MPPMSAQALPSAAGHAVALASVDVHDGGVVLRDLGSKHGTFVNETPIDAAEVQPGDEIRVGLSRFVVRFG